MSKMLCNGLGLGFVVGAVVGTLMALAGASWGEVAVVGAGVFVISLAAAVVMECPDSYPEDM